LEHPVWWTTTWRWRRWRRWWWWGWWLLLLGLLLLYFTSPENNISGNVIIGLVIKMQNLNILKFRASFPVPHFRWLLLLLDAVSLTDTVVDPSASYDTLTGHALRTFLMPDTFTQDGVLFAFIAHFVSTSPVRLQVWRPVGVSPSTRVFQLACQWEVDATTDQVSRRTVVCAYTTHICNNAYNNDKIIIIMKIIRFVECRGVQEFGFGPPFRRAAIPKGSDILKAVIRGRCRE